MTTAFGTETAPSTHTFPVISPGLSEEKGVDCTFRFPTQEEIQGEIAHVMSKTLSPELLRWIDGYAQVGKRNLYLWKWCRQGVEVTTLSSVARELYDYACDTKVLGVVLDVLIDDIADQGGNVAVLEQLLQMPFDRPVPKLDVPAESRHYVDFTVEIFEEIKRRTRRMPFYEEFATAWRYDYLQLFNAMRYAHMLNKEPAMLNMPEHDLYLPHNMHIMVSATIDLMCSPNFNRNEWGHLRECIWTAQYMGRIGNLVTTWERELGDADYTSGVYARAMSQGDITTELLRGADREAIANAIRSGNHEEFFLSRWARLRQRLLDLAPMVRTVNVRKLAEGYERLIRLHLGSRGYK